VSIHIAGWSRMHDTVAATLGAAGFNPFSNPSYGWSFVIFQILIWFAVDTCWQTTAMRTFSTLDSKISSRVFTWTGAIFLGRGMMPMLWGIAALTVLGLGQDSLQAMPSFLSKILTRWVLVLGGTCLLAAA